MAKRLSITISGAVSPGSDESDVAFEIRDTLPRHNNWAAFNDPEARIDIDVLTRASAGGMTVAMLSAEPSTDSIFSSGSVIAISQSSPGGRDATNPPTPSPWVDYIRLSPSDGSLNSSNHQDPLLWPINRSSHDRAELWKTVRAGSS